MPTESDSRTFNASIEEVREAAADALRSLGAEVEVSENGATVSGTTGWSLMSFFGEKVTINLEPEGDAVRADVHSKQSRGQFLDLGRRNQKNVGSILSSMSSRLK